MRSDRRRQPSCTVRLEFLDSPHLLLLAARIGHGGPSARAAQATPRLPVTIDWPKQALDEKWGLQRFGQCILGLWKAKKRGLE